MPWTLYRYILRELGAVLAVATLVLVVVLSFFVAIKPMADGLLGAFTLAKFVIYTMPTVLGFALPFAGAFASTLVFNRLASDNEIIACSASGLSFKRILLPVGGLGLGLTVMLLLLANFVVPGYYKKAAKLVQSDMITIMTNRLNQGMPFTRDKFVLYADHADGDRIAPEKLSSYRPGIEPMKLIVLDGVAAGQLDDQGGLQRDVTAQRATAFVYRQKGESWVEVMLRNAMLYDPVRREMAKAESYPIAPVALPNPFEDQPEFMSYGELEALGKHPQRFDAVAKASRRLEQQLEAEVLRQTLVDRLGGEPAKTSGQANPAAGSAHAGKSQDEATHDDPSQASAGRSTPPRPVTLIGPVKDERYTLKSPTVSREGKSLRLGSSASQPVEMVFRRAGKLTWRVEAGHGVAKVSGSTLRDSPVVLIELQDAKVYEPGPRQTYTERPTLSLPRLRWPVDILGRSADEGPLSAATLKRIIEGEPTLANAPALKRAQAQLGHRLLGLALQILAQKHERAALAVACSLLLVLGAVLSIYLRRQLTLVLYFWSFLLAVVTLVIIYTGSNLTQSVGQSPALGLSVMWSGNLLLAVMIVGVYTRIAR